MIQNTELLIYNGARVLPEHLIVQVIEHKNGGWDLNPKKEVKVTHISTGLSTSCMDDRSEHRNCDLAKQKLAVLLLQASTKTKIDAKAGQVYETRNGGIATVTSLLGEGFRCEHYNSMNYWHNAQGIANLGDVRTKNCLVPTDFDLVALKDRLSDQAVKPTYLTMEDLSDAAGILAAHGHKALSERLLANAETLDALRTKAKNKHDVVRYLLLNKSGFLVGRSHCKYESSNLKVIWVGTTGALKSAEVISHEDAIELGEKE